MLGMPGFNVLEGREVDGELELVVETDQVVVGSAGCGVRAVSHGRRDTLIRDLAVSGRPTRLRWRKRLCAATSRCARGRRGPSRARISVLGRR
jgi:hypothetical protein